MRVHGQEITVTPVSRGMFISPAISTLPRYKHEKGKDLDLTNMVISPSKCDEVRKGQRIGENT